MRLAGRTGLSPSPGGRHRPAHRPGRRVPLVRQRLALSGWAYQERFTYLWTELIPVLVFTAVGAAFWWLGRKTRAEIAVPAEPAALGEGA
jgi:hypothetical protein